MKASAQPAEPLKHQSGPGIRLIDCFTEAVAYTLYLVKCLDESQPDFNTVHDHFDTLLKRSAERAGKAKIPSSDWKKACFPVCAWIDEKLMCSPWDAKDAWQQNQLQLKFFQTTMAGREFYSRLERLKESERDIREVYTYCLALGYSGQYYTDDDQPRLSEIKVDNLLKYFSEDQEMNLPEALFPEAYQNRSGGEGRSKTAGIRSSLINVLILLLPPLLVMGAYVFYYDSLQRLVGTF